MGTVTTSVGDDVDLDALMLRVREAAMTGAGSGAAVQPQAGGDGTVREIDLITLIDAQADWNEQARQSFAALVDCIRAMRDDWAEVHAGLRRDIGQLSALVEQLRPAASPPGARAGSPAHTPPRTRRAVASPRGGKGRPAGKRKARS